MVQKRAGQKLYLRHSGARVAPAMRANVLAVEVLEAVHAFVFIRHGVHSFVVRKSATARRVLEKTSSMLPAASSARTRWGCAAANAS